MSKSKKAQGKTAKTGEMSDHRIQMSPDKSKGRGIGSEFAYSVKQALEKSADMKKNHRSFLNENSEVISIQEINSLVEGK